MIICFSCSRETKRALDLLLEYGQYKDYGEAISEAIRNQVILHEEFRKTGDVIITTGFESESALCAKEPTSWTESTEIPEQGVVVSKPSGVPTLFHLEGLPEFPANIANPPDDIWAVGQRIPLDRWIFGQYNRLLPAKASCRALAHILHQESRGVSLEEVASRIAEDAAALGEFLSKHDKKNAISRDFSLSTAFPSTGRNSEKSRARYANHFVASVNSHGQVSGLLIDLKLINSTGLGSIRLMLTEIGWQFARLPNPVLDGMQETPTQKFSEDEREFLLDHIAQSVPVEDFAYRAILAAIRNGENTPNLVDEAMRVFLPQDPERSMSPSFLTSQRSGAVSRMTDLGLVERVRQGVRVTYVVTDAGERFLQNAQS